MSKRIEQAGSNLTHYERLGIKDSANENEIQQAYDSFTTLHRQKKIKDAQFDLIYEAYLVLIDPKTRRQYDFIKNGFTHKKASTEPLSSESLKEGQQASQVKTTRQIVCENANKQLDQQFEAYKIARTKEKEKLLNQFEKDFKENTYKYLTTYRQQTKLALDNEHKNNLAKIKKTSADLSSKINQARLLKITMIVISIVAPLIIWSYTLKKYKEQTENIKSLKERLKDCKAQEVDAELKSKVSYGAGVELLFKDKEDNWKNEVLSNCSTPESFVGYFSVNNIRTTQAENITKINEDLKKTEATVALYKLQNNAWLKTSNDKTKLITQFEDKHKVSLSATVAEKLSPTPYKPTTAPGSK